MFRSWGSHYRTGDLVLTKFPDGEMGLMVVMDHTGDFHHRSVRVHVLDEEDVPEGHMRLKADPSEKYYSYWAGPVVAHLNEAQIKSLTSGIDVADLDKPTVSAKTILSTQFRKHHGPYKAE